jgi:tyrosyl-tRNA synthetase
MSIPDDSMPMFRKLASTLDARAMFFNPRDEKMAIAWNVVAQFHGDDAAEQARAAFVKQFVDREVPDDIREVQVNGGKHHLPTLLVLLGLAKSKTEATRKIGEGAVKLSDVKVDPDQKEVEINAATVVKLGRQYVRIVPSLAPASF